MKKLRGLSALIVMLATAEAAGQRYASPTGSNVYPYKSLQTAAHRIQDAIQAGLDEWYATLVWVAEGRYQENIVIPPWSKVCALVPGSCVITPEVVGVDIPVVTVEYGAQFSGFIVDGAGCGKGIVCNGGTVRECTVFGADTGADVSGGFVETCAFLHNSSPGIYVSGATVVYDTVVAGNLQGIYGTGDTGYSFLVHCTVTGNFGGVLNLDCMKVSMRDSIVWGNGANGAWEPVFSDIGDPGLAGINGNISADPLFVGWGEFNDSDNPIYVDWSNGGGEDGTKESPFRTISAALRKYDFHLAVGSPCLGAASDGLNIGAFPYDTPVRAPGPSFVRIQVAPGLYDEGGLLLAQGEHLNGPGPGLVTIAPRRHLHAASLGRGSAIEGFFILVDQAGAVYAGAGTTVANCVITTRGLSPWTPSDVGIASDGRIVNCVVHQMCYGIEGPANIVGCIVTANQQPVIFQPQAPPTIKNSILWGNGSSTLTLPPENVSYSVVSDPTLAGINGNILADPMFVDLGKGDFRLMPHSPCIDAGFNDPELPETDIAGMHRIMYGGKSLRVDMGAYEFYINDLTPGPNPDQTTFTWSSLAEKTYSILYTDDLLTWHLALSAFPSSGNTTTSWLDDGSLTGLPPSLVPRRFYRMLENP